MSEDTWCTADWLDADADVDDGTDDCRYAQAGDGSGVQSTAGTLGCDFAVDGAGRRVDASLRAETTKEEEEEAEQQQQQQHDDAEVEEEDLISSAVRMSLYSGASTDRSSVSELDATATVVTNTAPASWDDELDLHIATRSGMSNSYSYARGESISEEVDPFAS